MVSIVVLNWNGKRFLKQCLGSLEKITTKSIEIIVVDNASVDGSVEYIKRNFNKVKIIANKENYGFAKGNNIGFSQAKGKYVLILNNDTVVTPNFLDSILEDFKKDNKIACLQPQIRLLENKNTLDGVGAFLTPTGFLYHYGYLKNIRSDKYNKLMNIFSAKGACIILKNEIIKKIGLFDEDFFIFFEETDLCYRIWLAGYKVVYEPNSIIYHVGGGDTDSSNSYHYTRRMYLTFKNMVCCYVKNFGTRNLISIFPVFMLTLWGLFFYYFITLRFGLAKVILKAYLWNIVNIRSTLLKRAIIQHKIRNISDSKLKQLIIRIPKLSYYYLHLTGGLASFQE